MKWFWGLVAGIILSCILGVVSVVAIQGQQKFGFSNHVTPYNEYSQSNAEAATTTRFFGTVSPQVTAKYDLGEPKFSWNNIYASGTATFGTVSSTNSNSLKLTFVDGTGTHTLVMLGLTTLQGTSSTGGIYPTSNNSYELGGSSLAWSNLNVSGTAFLANVSSTRVTSTVMVVGDGSAASPSITDQSATNLGIFFVPGSNRIGFASGGSQVLKCDGGDCTFQNQTIFSNTAKPNANNTVDLGSSANSWRNLYASSTSFLSGVSSTGGLYPNANNSYELGGPSLAWSNINASGTAFLANVTSTGIIANAVTSTKFFASNGSSGAPSYTFVNDNQTGFFLNAVGDWRMAAGGATKITINGSGVTLANGNLNNGGVVNIGSQGTPFNGLFSTTVSSTNATTTFGNVDNILTVVNKIGVGETAPSAALDVQGTVSSTVDLTASGSAVAPSHSFAGATGDGMYDVSSGQLRFTVGGVDRFMIGTTVSTTRNILPTSNNAIDLGAAVSSWQNLYVSSTAFMGGDVIIPGIATGTVGNADDFVCWADDTTIGKLSHKNANCTVSSIRFKEHVRSLDPQKLLDEVSRLRAVEYDRRGTGKHEEGLIAEEVAMIDPLMVEWEEATSTWDVETVKKAYPDLKLFSLNGHIMIPRTVDYMRLTVLEAGAIQAQQDELKAMDSRLTKVEHRVGILERLWNSLKAFIHTLRH